MIRAMNKSVERDATSYNGYVMLLLFVVVTGLALWGFFQNLPEDGMSKAEKITFVASLVGLLIGPIFILVGFFMIQPNQAAVITLFGEYRGT